MNQVRTLTVLLGIALVAAYLVAFSEDSESSADEVVVLPGNADDIESVTYTSDESTVSVSVREDGLGRYTWIRVVDSPSIEEGDDDDSATDEEPPAAVAAPPPEDEVTVFLGSARAMALVEDFAPLTARRSLGTLDAAKLDELELTSPSSSLGVVRRGREASLALGGETFGTRHRYASYEGQVFVLGNTLVRPLSQAKTRLVERKLVGWDEAEIESISIDTASGPVALEQANRDDREEAYWTTSGTAGANEEATDWVERLLRLRARTYLEEEPGELVPILTPEAPR